MAIQQYKDNLLFKNDDKRAIAEGRCSSMESKSELTAPPQDVQIRIKPQILFINYVIPVHN